MRISPLPLVDLMQKFICKTNAQFRLDEVRSQRRPEISPDATVYVIGKKCHLAFRENSSGTEREPMRDCPRGVGKLMMNLHYNKEEH